MTTEQQQTADEQNETQAEQQQTQPKLALVMVAHPDDAEFMCAGTVAKLCAQGWEVYYCLATSGDKGTKDPEMTPERLAGIREEEQRAAARILGVRDVIFLRHADGFVENDFALRGEIVRLIRQLKPDTVITWDGFRRGFNHNDHRNVGIATYDAVFPASRDPLYYPEHIDQEGLSWHRVGELLLAGSDEPDYFVDISDHFDTKIEALLAHTSQVARDQTREQWVEMMRKRVTEGAETSGIAYAEAFRRVTLRT
jgi:LmbE family N-acetylglucosaminyl deacetylase